MSHRCRKVYCTKRFDFEAAHFLGGYEGNCGKLHGHTYTCEITVQGYVCDYPDNVRDSMVIDFSVMKDWCNKIKEKYDHAFLNDLFDENTYTTAETIAIAIYHYVENTLLPRDVTIESVKLWETKDSFVEYRGDIIG